MNLYTPADFNLNHEARVNTIDLILSYRELYTTHANAGRKTLAKGCLTRIAEAEYNLYKLNKDYDEMIIANMEEVLPERKPLIKKLLRK